MRFPLVEDPREAPALRWGVLGSGLIADRVVGSVHRETRQRFVAVGSRVQARAEAFARSHGLKRAYGTYAQLLDDPTVEVVYVATPHSEHHANAIDAIDAGKHVLVEKAFTRNGAEAHEVVDAAERAGVFCMEAMWTAHLPHIKALRSLLTDGVIGSVQTLSADHHRFFPFDSAHRIYDPALAGGALLDLGVYPVAVAQLLLKAPTRVQAAAEFTRTGVDGRTSMVLVHDDAAHSMLSTSLWSEGAATAALTGTEGRLEVAGAFFRPSSFVITRRDGSTLRFDSGFEQGLHFQAAEVARQVADGAIESPAYPHKQTLEVMATLDEVRRQIGLIYPGEREPG